MIGQVELSLAKQQFFYDALLEIPPLGIKNDVKVFISPKTASFSTKKRLAGALEMDLDFQTKNFSLEETFVQGRFEQSALDKISTLLSDNVKKLNKENQAKLRQATAKLNKAQDNVKAWEKKAKEDIGKWVQRETAKLQKPIDELKAKIKASRERCAAAPKGKGRKIKACVEETLTPARWATIKGLEAARDIGLKKIAQSVAKSGTKFVSFVARDGIGSAKLAVESTRRSLDTLTKVSDFFGKLARGTINIKSIEIKKGTLDKLIREKKFSKVVVKGTVLGRPFCQVYELDVSKPEKFVGQIAKGLVQIFGPAKIGKAIADQCSL